MKNGLDQENCRQSLKKFYQNNRYFPCYRDRSDNIIGYVDVEDFCDPGNVSLAQVLNDPIFFPEVKPLSDLLYSMVEKNLHVVFL